MERTLWKEETYGDIYKNLIRNSVIVAADFVCERQGKNKACFEKVWRSFENILPSILAILLLIGFILTFLDGRLAVLL